LIKYLLQRLLILGITFFGVCVIAFSLIRLIPGDPVLLLVGERGASPEVYAEMRHNLGLDQPVLTQFFIFVGNALRGDLGISVASKQPVLQEFIARYPATLELGFVALLLAVIVGIPFGILAAVKRNSVLDYSVMGASLVGYSMPIFWWGLILILIFSVTLGWTPVSGRMSVEFDVRPVTGFMLIDVWFSEDKLASFWDALQHLLLPAIALGTIPLAVIARMTRSAMLEVLGEDYIRTAKAKGLSSFSVIVIHALRNAAIPITTVIGLMVGTIITGAILTETIFSWPGIGKWLVRSVTSLDYPVVQGGILLIAALIVLTNLLVDITYLIINPKMRKRT
jgi:dipeptide transport system permease protein